MISTIEIEREKKKVSDQKARDERERRKNAKSKVIKFLAYNNYRAALKQAYRDEILDEIPKRILRKNVTLFTSSKDVLDLKIAQFIFKQLGDTASVQLLDNNMRKVVNPKINQKRPDGR
jgi:hypothetical protein